MLGEEYPDWDCGDEEAEDAEGATDLMWEGGIGVAEAGEEGWSFAAGDVRVRLRGGGRCCGGGFGGCEGWRRM